MCNACRCIVKILWTITGVATLASGAAALGKIGITVAELTVAECTLTITVSSISAVAGTIVSATNWALDVLQTKTVSDFAKGGYHKILPGQTYTSGKKSLALNMRVWLVRIRRTPTCIVIRRSDSSVWSGCKQERNNIYNVMDARYFSKWNAETIPAPADVQLPIALEHPSEVDEEYSIVDSVIDTHCTEHETSSSWVQVDTSSR